MLDKGSVELVGPYGLEKALSRLSKLLSNLDTGVVTTYALYILIGLVSFLSIIYTGISNYLLFIIFINVLLSRDKYDTNPELEKKINLSKEQYLCKFNWNSLYFK